MSLAQMFKPGTQLESLRATAFDLWPEPALVIGLDGVLIGVNEAAEDLFGQWLPMLARGPILKALPADSPIAALMARCAASQSPVRVRDAEVSFFANPVLHVDAAATPLPDVGLLLTLHIRSSTPAADRMADAEGLQSVMGLGQMLAHEVKTPWPGFAARPSSSRWAPAPRTCLWRN